MRILLLGYGKMGKTIEQLALERNHEIVGRIEINNQESLTQYSDGNTDVAIEFSQPNAAFNNIQYCLSNNIKVVSGTTGWLGKKEKIDQLCQEKGGAFFYASNFSIGVNLFFKLNKTLASLMSEFDQ